MSTKTERRVALSRALALGMAGMLADPAVSEEARRHLLANVETVLDQVIGAVYADAAFDAGVACANGLTQLLYASARICYDADWVEASTVLQRMAASAFQGQRELLDGPRRGPLVDVLAGFFDDYGPTGEYVS